MTIASHRQHAPGSSQESTGVNPDFTGAKRGPVTPSRWRLATFAAAVLSLGWLGPVLDRATDSATGEGPGQLLWLILPIGTALVLRMWGGDGFTDAGLRPRYRANRRWYDLSSAFYPVAMLSAAAVGLLLGDRVVTDDGSPIRFAVLALVALVPFTVAAIAEEFGWRGYLTPRLDAAGFGRLTNHVIVGVIWGAWHLPYMTLFWDFTDESLWTLAPRVILGTTVAAVLYGEIRLRTGSVWPAVLMHAAGNAVATPLLDDGVLTQQESTPWISSPGIDGPVVIAITAVLAAVLYFRPQSDTTVSR